MYYANFGKKQLWSLPGIAAIHETNETIDDIRRKNSLTTTAITDADEE
jgi:hypothetical protein